MNDTQLISDCIRHDAKAQKALYESYLPYVLTIVRRFGFMEQDIPDVIQEIFIEVFSCIHKYRSKKGTFKFWLKSIAVHKILNTLRKKKQLTPVDLEVIDHDGLITEIDLKEFDTEYLIKLIAELPDGYRTVFNLFVVDGYSHKEISKMLGINKASSRSQLSRAKQLLKEKLGKLMQSNFYGLI